MGKGGNGVGNVGAGQWAFPQGRSLFLPYFVISGDGSSSGLWSWRQWLCVLVGPDIPLQFQIAA